MTLIIHLGIEWFEFICKLDREGQERPIEFLNGFLDSPIWFVRPPLMDMKSDLFVFFFFETDDQVCEREISIQRSESGKLLDGQRRDSKTK